MANLSPKIEIIKHFDNLINRLDIDIEQSIEEYKEDQLLREVLCFPVKHTNIWRCYHFEIGYFDSNESSNKSETVIEWPESTKVIDYLNQIRQRTIDELRKAQEDSLEHLKSESCDLDHIKQSKDVEEMKSRLFADKFYFQVFIHRNSRVFNIYTIATDFYLTPSEITFLEYLINAANRNIKKSCLDPSRIFDEKFVLILSIDKRIRKNIKYKQYPSHLINLCKRDLLNIHDIQCEINPSQVNLNNSCNYLSNLENLSLDHSSLKKVKIEGLSSLKSLSLGLKSIEEASFGKMYSLRKLELNLDVENELNEENLAKLFEVCPNIEELALIGKFSNIIFDSFVDLKKLLLDGYLLDDFNFDVFKNICNQLEELRFKLYNINNESNTKLLDGHNFSNLSNFGISSSSITRLEKKMFDGFPVLKSLDLSDNRILKTIDKDAFINLKYLNKIKLDDKNLLNELDSSTFPNIKECEIELE